MAQDATADPLNATVNRPEQTTSPARVNDAPIIKTPAPKAAPAPSIILLEDPSLLSTPDYRRHYETYIKWGLEEHYRGILNQLSESGRETLLLFLLRRHMSGVERSTRSDFFTAANGGKEYDQAAEMNQLKLDLGLQEFTEFENYSLSSLLQRNLEEVNSRLRLRREPLSKAQTEAILEDMLLLAVDNPYLLTSPTSDFSASFQRHLTPSQLVIWRTLNPPATDEEASPK